MGFRETFADFLSSLPLTGELHAEAPEEEEKDEGEGGGEEEKAEGEGEGGEEGGDGGDEGGDGGDDEEEEEEEEEDEPVDLKPKLEEECSRSAQCAPLKHHYDDCVARVTTAQENPDHKGPHEDCVEEFFHLQHCATQCAAPKLFRTLK